VIVMVVGVAAVVFAGCGAGEQHEIAGVVQHGMTSHDPRTVCEGSLAPGLLTRIYGGAAQCHEIERAPGEQIGQAQSVDVMHVRVDGGRATAAVAIHGGSHDGASGTLVLERRGEGWRVADLAVDLLRSQFEVSLRAAPGVSAPAKACIAKKMREVDDAAFKRIAIAGGPAAQRQLTRIAAVCESMLAAEAKLRV
jgi:hypothetical protein